MTGGNIRFDRNEVSGSFGDIGTDLPLIVGMILTCRLDGASALTMFGLMQILTGLIYGIPMPVQPLKAMAVIMISQKLEGGLLYGAGLAIGIMMLTLTLTGLLEWLARIIPKCVVRGIQFGLGLSLATLALKNYVLSESYLGYLLAALGFVITLVLLNNRRYPPALFVMLLGILYAALFKIDFTKIGTSLGFTLPRFHVPAWPDILQGFVLLALPQIPLSIANSVIATQRTVEDLFPGHPLTVRKIGLTYTMMNLIHPFFGGIPTCHGTGGLAGHYAFGARTGGSVILYGSMYLLLGLFFSRGFAEVIQVFPLPILGVVLLFESLTLMSFLRDLSDSKKDLLVSLLVALAAFSLPNGYVIGLVGGTLLAYLMNKKLLIRSV